MAEDSPSAGVPDADAVALKREEMELRRYEAQMGLRKVIYGTMIVGLAGVMIPAAVEGWSLVFQKWQNEARLAFEQSQAEATLRVEAETRQEDFVKTHFETAIDESLELRLRFAEYYAFTVDGYDRTDGETRKEWGRYYDELKAQRDKLRAEILEKEREARRLLAIEEGKKTIEDDLRLAELEIELDWLYAEIEYTEPGRETKPRSSVLSEPEDGSRRTVEDYKTILGEEAYGPDTSDLIPTDIQAMAVLGEPGPEIETCLVTFEFPAPLPLDWNRSQTVSRAKVHKAVLPHFQQAFESVVEAELDLEKEMRFAGIYNKRKLRGSNAWSLHSFGISVDFNAAENSLRFGQDRMTMHPEIVTAFKEAGFAWYGDRGSDGMGFVVSTDTLDDIAAEGFDPVTDCRDP